MHRASTAMHVKLKGLSRRSKPQGGIDGDRGGKGAMDPAFWSDTDWDASCESEGSLIRTQHD